KHRIAVDEITGAVNGVNDPFDGPGGWGSGPTGLLAPKDRTVTCQVLCDEAFDVLVPGGDEIMPVGFGCGHHLTGGKSFSQLCGGDTGRIERLSTQIRHTSHHKPAVTKGIRLIGYARKWNQQNYGATS